jgi:hypothetical protein
MSLSNAPSTSNVSENWIAQFTADNKHCLDFDGANDKVTFGNIFPLYTTYTIEAWIKPDTVSTTGKAFILWNGNQDYDENTEANNVTFSLFQSGNDVGYYYQHGASTNVVVPNAGNNVLTADTWVHLALVRNDADGNSIKLYVNGVLSYTTTSLTTDSTGGGSSVFNIGYGEYGQIPDDEYFNGEIAHVRVWNVARSAADILQYMNRSVVGTESGLQGYWKLNEGTGTSVDDLTSNNNNGTLSGPTWSINGFDKFIFDFGLSLTDTIVDNDYHYGSILNKSITIRDSIDLTKSTSSTGNISITSANFTTNGTDFYKLLFNGDNNYHNKEVRLYAQFSGESDLDDCQRIFTGRLVDIALDQNQNIKMQINSHRPWDKIEFPQTKSLNNVYQPVVYGDYSAHEDQGLVRDFANAVHPVPFKRKGITTDHLIIPAKSYSNIYPHYYDATADAFLPIKSDNYTAATKNLDVEYDSNVNIGLVSREMQRRFRINPIAISSDGSTTMTNAKNLLLDRYSASGAYHAYGPATSSQTKNTYLNFAAELSKINDSDLDIKGTVVTPSGQVSTNLTLRINYSGDGDNYYSGGFAANQTLAITLANGLAGAAAVKTSSYGTMGITISNNNLHTVNLSTTISSATGSDNVVMTVTIQDYVLYLDVQQSYDEDDANTNNSITAAANLKYLYLGVDGLTASWDSGAISHGHDAHRDMLIRFAGVSTEDPEVNTGEAWSVLNTDRAIDNWKVRYWQLEPTSLKDALDKMAYESGFISKFSSSNQLKYIYVKKSSELSALLNLTKDDITNVSVSTTGIDNVHATMDISNKLHPADSNRYYSTTTATDASLITKYNLGDKEGIASVNLDMNVGTIPATANADCNADWYSYMHNIIGDMKILVNCEVVNPAKGYQLETGDVVTFTDMPVEMFGTDFSTSKYFMIIETKRSPGKVSITAREVG